MSFLTFSPPVLFTSHWGVESKVWVALRRHLASNHYISAQLTHKIMLALKLLTINEICKVEFSNLTTNLKYMKLIFVLLLCPWPKVAHLLQDVQHQAFNGWGICASMPVKLNLGPTPELCSNCSVFQLRSGFWKYHKFKPKLLQMPVLL